MIQRDRKMSKRPIGHQPSSGVSAQSRWQRALEADLEVVAAPWMLRLRLLIAAALGIAFGAVGLTMTASGSIGLLDRSMGPLGNAAGAVAVGVAASAISVVVFGAGLASYRAYRKRGLL